MDDHDTDASKQLASHREAIHRYIRGIVRDAAVAEDLTQETLIRAHSKLATLEDPARLGPWLSKIQIKSLWVRRGLILDLADHRIAELGEDEVLFD